MNCWRAPAKSLDLNPIDNLWHELKEFVQREVKPYNKRSASTGDSGLLGNSRSEQVFDVHI